MKGGSFYLSDLFSLVTTLFFVTSLTISIALMIFLLNINIDVKVFGDIVAGEDTSSKVLLTFLRSDNDGKSINEQMAFVAADGKIGGTLKKDSEVLMKKILTNNQAYKISLKTEELEEIVAERGTILKDSVIVEAPIETGGKTGSLTLELNRGWER